MIKTKRLVIKPYSIDDENRMIEILINKAIKDSYIIPDFSTFEDAKNYFMKLMDFSLSAQHYERGIYFDNQLIGFVNDVEIENKSIEIGYVIHPNYHHQGYATEMLAAVINDLFSIGYKEVKCCAFEFNRASFRVMEKCQMKPTNQVVEMTHQFKKQRCIYYAIKRSDFKVLELP